MKQPHVRPSPTGGHPTCNLWRHLAATQSRPLHMTRGFSTKTHIALQISSREFFDFVHLQPHQESKVAAAAGATLDTRRVHNADVVQSPPLSIRRVFTPRLSSSPGLALPHALV